MFPLWKLKYQQICKCIKMHTDTVHTITGILLDTALSAHSKWITALLYSFSLHDSFATFLEKSSWEYANSLPFYGSLWKQICCGGHCCTVAACVIACKVSILQWLSKNSLHLLYLQHEVNLILTSYRIHDGGPYLQPKLYSIDVRKFIQSSEFINS